MSIPKRWQTPRFDRSHSSTDLSISSHQRLLFLQLGRIYESDWQLSFCSCWNFRELSFPAAQALTFCGEISKGRWEDRKWCTSVPPRSKALHLHQPAPLHLFWSPKYRGISAVTENQQSSLLRCCSTKACMQHEEIFPSLSQLAKVSTT